MLTSWFCGKLNSLLQVLEIAKEPFQFFCIAVEGSSFWGLFSALTITFEVMTRRVGLTVWSFTVEFFLCFGLFWKRPQVLAVVEKILNVSVYCFLSKSFLYKSLSSAKYFYFLPYPALWFSKAPFPFFHPTCLCKYFFPFPVLLVSFSLEYIHFNFEYYIFYWTIRQVIVILIAQ